MVNAKKHKALLEDKDTRINKQATRSFLLSNNSKKKYKSLSKLFETKYQSHNKTLDSIAERKTKNKEAIVWI